MFSTLPQRLLLAGYIILILSIPIGSYFFSQQSSKISTATKDEPITKGPTSSPTSSPKFNVLGEETVSPISTSPPTSNITPVFGPTLSFKIAIGERPKDNQAGRLFVGILAGQVSANPQFLLSYTIDLPASGQFSGVSLAGLDAGTMYSAILKGSAQIATSSAFILSPKNTVLNSGLPINLISGDLNDDNIISLKDYSLVQQSLGSTINSGNWNENADFNKDGVINTLDLAVISKNLGKIGEGGEWVSSSTPSSISSDLPTGSSEPPAETPPDESQGYWIWVPKR